MLKLFMCTFLPQFFPLLYVDSFSLCYLILIFWGLFFVIFERTIKEREGMIKIVHLLNHFSNRRSGKMWTGPRPGASLGLLHGGEGPSIQSIPCCFSRKLAQNRSSKTRTSDSEACWHLRPRLNALCHKAGPSAVFLRSNVNKKHSSQQSASPVTIFIILYILLYSFILTFHF